MAVVDQMAKFLQKFSSNLNYYSSLLLFFKHFNFLTILEIN